MTNCHWQCHFVPCPEAVAPKSRNKKYNFDVKYTESNDHLLRQYETAIECWVDNRWKLKPEWRCRINARGAGRQNFVIIAVTPMQFGRRNQSSTNPGVTRLGMYKQILLSGGLNRRYFPRGNPETDSNGFKPKLVMNERMACGVQCAFIYNIYSRYNS